MKINVKLSNEEIELSKLLGARRLREDGGPRGARHEGKMADNHMHYWGSLGEVAVSKYFGLPMTGAVTSRRFRERYPYASTDVLGMEVRTSPHGNHLFIFGFDHEKPNVPCVQVRGHHIKDGFVELIGWKGLREAMAPEYENDKSRWASPTHVVPPDALGSIDGLKEFMLQNEDGSDAWNLTGLL